MAAEKVDNQQHQNESAQRITDLERNLLAKTTEQAILAQERDRLVAELAQERQASQYFKSDTDAQTENLQAKLDSAEGSVLALREQINSM